MAPLRSLSNPVSSFDDPFAKTSARAGEVWFPYTGIIGNRAIVAGGMYNTSIAPSPYRADVIEFFDITTTGNATDFGDLPNATMRMGGCQAAHRGVFMGASGPLTPDNTITYVTVAIPGDAQDFGDLNEGRSSGGAASNSTRGVLGGGSAPSPIGESTAMDYITIATTGNGTDFGNLTSARYGVAACASTLGRGVWAGGYEDPGPGGKNIMDYATIATTGNASDFGDLAEGVQRMAGCSPGIYGYFMGGNNTPAVNPFNNTQIQKITIATTGNASTPGNLTFRRSSSTGMANSSRGICAAGDAVSWPYNNDGYLNQIEYFDGVNGGNSADFGDLTIRAKDRAGLSGE